MKIKCVIEIEHNGRDFDESLLANDLTDFLEENEQTYYDKAEVKVMSNCSCAYMEVNNG